MAVFRINDVRPSGDIPWPALSQSAPGGAACPGCQWRRLLFEKPSLLAAPATFGRVPIATFARTTKPGTD